MHHAVAELEVAALGAGLGADQERQVRLAEARDLDVALRGGELLVEDGDVRAAGLLEVLLQLLEPVEVAHEDERLLLLLVPLAHARGEPLAARILLQVLAERPHVDGNRAARRQAAEVAAAHRARAREHRVARGDRAVELLERGEAIGVQELAAGGRSRAGRRRAAWPRAGSRAWRCGPSARPRRRSARAPAGAPRRRPRGRARRCAPGASARGSTPGTPSRSPRTGGCRRRRSPRRSRARRSRPAPRRSARTPGGTCGRARPATAPPASTGRSRARAWRGRCAPAPRGSGRRRSSCPGRPRRRGASAPGRSSPRRSAVWSWCGKRAMRPPRNEPSPPASRSLRSCRPSTRLRNEPSRSSRNCASRSIGPELPSAGQRSLSSIRRPSASR